jgi:hypothetical protein
MKFVRIEEWLLPEYREQARQNVVFLEREMQFVCDGMRHYIRSKDEFMSWVDEMYEEADNAYQDWLSTQ